METTKICNKCGKKSPATVEFFYKEKRVKDGLTGDCRACLNEYKRKRRRGNEAFLRKRREDYAKRYGPINREKERIRKLEHPLRVRAQVLRQGMRTRAKELKLPYEHKILTVRYLMDRIKSAPKCECCEIELDLSGKSDGMKRDNSPSIDRFDVGKGYTVTNISILCWRCNNLKRDATPKELQTIVDWMVSRGDVGA